MTHQYTFLINPAAKSGNAKQTWLDLSTYLNNQQIEYSELISQTPGDVQKLAQRFAETKPSEHQHLVVVGGDGTLNEAINGILLHDPQAEVPLAYLPAGSGNDFARAHGLAQEPLESLKMILKRTQQGDPEKVDIGEYVDSKHQMHRFFVNNIGVGFDAMTVSLTNHSKYKVLLNKFGLGKVAYFSSIFRTILLQDTFPVEVKWGEQKEYLPHAYLVTVSNHPYFGGGIKIMADANPRDGKMDLIVIENVGSKIRILYILQRLMAGKHYSLPEVHRYTASELEIKTGRLEHGHIDGEELGTHTFDLNLKTRPYPFWV